MNLGRAAAAALWLPLAAVAADWVKVPAPDQNQHWYDRSKLIVDGNAITYWRRVEFRAPQRTKAGTAASAMYRERIDCRAHTQRTLGYLLYAKDGAVLENVHQPDVEAEAIIPETVGDQYEKLMCALVAEQTPDTPTAYPGPESITRSAEEIRQEIEWLEARLRILHQQLDQQSRTESAPGAPAPETR
jgi:Surface-adhesin protein E